MKRISSRAFLQQRDAGVGNASCPTGYGNSAHHVNRRALALIGPAMEECFTAPRAGFSRDVVCALDEVSYNDQGWVNLREELQIKTYLPYTTRPSACDRPPDVT
jgi:hypothetical protein